jgi:hypothetical protein
MRHGRKPNLLHGAIFLSHYRASGLNGGEGLEHGRRATTQVEKVRTREGKIDGVALSHLGRCDDQSIVLAPMPSAIVAIATTARSGLLRNVRAA